MPNIGNVKSSGYGQAKRSPSRERQQRSSQAMRAARMDATTNQTGVTGMTAQPNASGAIGDATGHQTGVTSLTALPNDPFGAIVEQADPVVVHAESEVGQPMCTEIPLETRHETDAGDPVPRRELNSREAERIVDAMLEEAKGQTSGPADPRSK